MFLLKHHRAGSGSLDLFYHPRHVSFESHASGFEVRLGVSYGTMSLLAMNSDR